MVSKKLFTQQELSVLTHLLQRRGGEIGHCEIGEISSETGIKSNEEVQRALYVLEGKALVTPEPAGDLTSNVWKITDGGIRALGMLEAT